MKLCASALEAEKPSVSAATRQSSAWSTRPMMQLGHARARPDRCEAPVANNAPKPRLRPAVARLTIASELSTGALCGA